MQLRCLSPQLRLFTKRSKPLVMRGSAAVFTGPAQDYSINVIGVLLWELVVVV
jgi:hypothetical protein